MTKISIKKIIFFINQNILLFLKKIFLKPKEIYYINGPETLPPPLDKKEESEKKIEKEKID